MLIKLINTYNEIRKYITRVKNNEMKQKCWKEEVVSPYWNNICRYAPMDLS